jgi:catechol 2,3-dioxygenase-like lactoylglutathione lyase family enzyme
MGSGGAWHLAARYPERWRAVAPMSGPFVDEATYPFERIRRLPIFMTEGTGATPSLEGSRVLARYMRERGFAFEYLEVDGNHGSMVPMVWPRIFEFFNAIGKASFTHATPSDSPVRGLYNWIHGTGDAERSFSFYRDVFGIELARSPFAGTASANAPPETIRPVSQAGSDPLVWALTNTHGSRFRTVFMRAANTPFGLELSEFFDVPRSDRQANPWDPGASKLIFTVRDLNAVVARLTMRRTPVVTVGGAAVNTPSGRAILVRDPDGYLVEVRQASSAAMTAAKASGDVIETAIWISVARRERALAFYEKLLGFQVRATHTASDAELRLNGLSKGKLTDTIVSIPGIETTVTLAEFALPATTNPPPMPFEWRIQDIGSPQFQLEVAGLDALLERTARAGYRFLSVGGQPIQRPFGRFVFAIDPDGILVEFVEPAIR